MYDCFYVEEGIYYRKRYSSNYDHFAVYASTSTGICYTCVTIHHFPCRQSALEFARTYRHAVINGLPLPNKPFGQMKYISRFNTAVFQGWHVKVMIAPGEYSRHTFGDDYHGGYDDGLLVAKGWRDGICQEFGIFIGEEQLYYDGLDYTYY